MTELAEGAATEEHGTKITFLPDLEIFEDEIEFDFQTLAERLRETAFLTRGLKIELIDERGRPTASPSSTRAGSRTSSATSTRTRTICTAR